MAEARALSIATLCTGNVARSVMLGYMLTSLAEAEGRHWRVRTAGTHVVEGSAMSARTRDALIAIGELGDHHYSGHRSHQLTRDDVEWADVVLATEAAQVRLARSWFPELADRIVHVGQFVRHAPLDAPVSLQVAAVAALEPDASFDIVDPAGGDEAVYLACARELWEIAQVFAVVVVESGP